LPKKVFFTLMIQELGLGFIKLFVWNYGIIPNFKD